jgi:predicted DNA-binding WGR domain protein
MSTSSRTVRLFISSTFRDFAEERDLLVRKVFPELRRPAGTTRRFEHEGGGSSKFWETELRGNELVTRFGRLGTTGQAKTKTFPDAAAAAQEQARLIRDKTAKGYQEV